MIGQVCRCCKEPRIATHRIVSEVRWPVCEFHAISAVNCGFLVKDIMLGKTLSTAEAMKRHLENRRKEV